MAFFSSFFKFFSSPAFILDPRSLSLFRIGLALLILTDFVFVRGPVYDLFYGNTGIFPVEHLLALEKWGGPSLYFMWTASWYQLLLFYITIVLSFLFLIGYKTRWVNFGLWVLIVSITAKNYLVNNIDYWIIIMLFWSFFLPLSGYWSVDGAVDNFKKQGSQLKNLKATIYSKAFIIQLLIIYIFAFLEKEHPVWRVEGTAVYYSLNLEMFRTYFGDILLQFPLVMKALTFSTIYLFELTPPILYLLFGRIWQVRLGIVILMIFFHIGLGTFLWLGSFQFVPMVFWSALLPTGFWDKLQTCLKNWQSHLTVYYDSTSEFIKLLALIKSFFILPFVSFKERASQNGANQSLSEVNILSSWHIQERESNQSGGWSSFCRLMFYSPLFYPLYFILRLKLFERPGTFFYKNLSVQKHRITPFLSCIKEQKEVTSCFLKKLSYSVAWIFLVLCIVFNIFSIEDGRYRRHLPKFVLSTEMFFSFFQDWDMFAPPTRLNQWIVLKAQTKNGKTINVLNPSKPLHFNRPKRFISQLENSRVRKMLGNLIWISDNKFKGYEGVLGRYLTYHCDKWNKRVLKEEDQIQNLEFIYLEIKTPPPGQKPPEAKKVSVKTVRCLTTK